MKERPILFRGAMVRALLAGTKTQTRRPVRPQPEPIDGAWYWHSRRYDNGDGVHYFHTREIGLSLARAWAKACPFGRPGDRLWVRETWRISDSSSVFYAESPRSVHFRADRDEVSGGPGGPWRPSIFMPRWASRLTLEVTGVRVERLHDISEQDARAEGVAPETRASATTPCRAAFIRLWEENAAPGRGWEDNPWVWVVTFRRVEAQERTA